MGAKVNINIDTQNYVHSRIQGGEKTPRASRGKDAIYLMANKLAMV